MGERGGGGGGGGGGGRRKKVCQDPKAKSRNDLCKKFFEETFFQRHPMTRESRDSRPRLREHVSSRLVSSRLVSSRLVLSRLVSSRLVSSRLVSSRLANERDVFYGGPFGIQMLVVYKGGKKKKGTAFIISLNSRMCTSLYVSLLDSVWNPPQTTQPKRPLSEKIKPFLLPATSLTRATKRYRDLHDHLLDEEMDVPSKRRRVDSYLFYAETKLDGNQGMWFGPPEEKEAAVQELVASMQEEAIAEGATDVDPEPKTDINMFLVRNLTTLSCKLDQFARRKDDRLELRDVLPGGRRCDAQCQSTFDYCFSKFLLMRFVFDESMMSSNPTASHALAMIPDVRYRLLTSMIPMYLRFGAYNPYKFEPYNLGSNAAHDEDDDPTKIDAQKVIDFKKNHPDVVQKVYDLRFNKVSSWVALHRAFMLDSKCFFSECVGNQSAGQNLTIICGITPEEEEKIRFKNRGINTF